MRKILIFALGGFLPILLLFSCYPVVKKGIWAPEQALRPVRYFYPHFEDDLDMASLRLAIQRNLEYLRRLGSNWTFQYGPLNIPCQQVIQTQESFLNILELASTPDALRRAIIKNFIVLKAVGSPQDGKVLFTGYFEPTYEASLVRNPVFRYPIYGVPHDLVKIDLSLFNKKYRGQQLMGRLQGRSVVPYYSRDEIDLNGALTGRNLEIAWLKDPADALFLQIQGSGKLLLPDGSTIRVGYAGSNGHPYRSIGRYMIEKGYIDREDMSMQKIREFLHGHPHLINEIFSKNPSYVFFRILDDGPVGNLGVPLTPGRSIALDKNLFPKAALGFIKCQKPILTANGQIKRWVPFSRFVVNQDTGGAIKGAGRADIFWGSGHYAEIVAGHLKHKGDLYLLVKK